MWFVYIKNDPNDEKNISPNELKYIQGATGVRTSEVKVSAVNLQCNSVIMINDISPLNK